MKKKTPKTMTIKRERKKIKRTKGIQRKKGTMQLKKKSLKREKTVLQNSNEQNETKRNETYKDIWLHGFSFFCLIRSFVRVSFIYWRSVIDSLMNCFAMLCIL